jgi:Ner family transcriptional regulator
MSMTVREIRAELILVGTNPARIAAKIGVTRQAVSLVLLGKLRSPKIERAIAQAIGRPADEVFTPRTTEVA